jgi:hypothetical protein
MVDADGLRALIVVDAYAKMVDCGHDQTVDELGCAFTAAGADRPSKPEATLHLFLTDRPSLVLATTPWHPSEALGGEKAVLAECRFEPRGELDHVYLAATKGVPGWLYGGAIEVGVASECEVKPYAGLPRTMAAAHLLVMHDDSKRKPADVSRTRAEAIARVEQAARAADEPGSDFAKVAASFSDEPGAEQRGGELGRFPRGAMVPIFELVVTATPIGRRSAFFESEFGFHILERHAP